MPSGRTGEETEERVASHVGQYYAFLDEHAAKPAALSWLVQKDLPFEVWRDEARRKMAELLCYAPPRVRLEPQVLSSAQKDGYVRHHVRYTLAPGRTGEAYLLIPDALTAPAPAIVALHDHGGYYYHGKEKITETEDTPGSLIHHAQTYYSGRFIASDLARRGYVVLVPDAFYFGSQRLDPAEVPETFTQGVRRFSPDTDEYLQAFHRFAWRHEEIVAKTIFCAGATWPGILFHGDRIALDYLLSRPEVDSRRVGCIGLSLGGFRAAHLFGLDPRVQCGVAAGWMTTYRALLYTHLHGHTWMIYVPGQAAWLDLPDVPTLNAPRPFMVVNCARDILFTKEGMRDAADHLARVYAAHGHPERFRANTYDIPHSLPRPAQDDAFAWLDQHLAADRR